MNCVICKRKITGMGHNASPVAEGRCCTECNYKTVIPRRMAEFRIGEKNPSDNIAIDRLKEHRIKGDKEI